MTLPKTDIQSMAVWEGILCVPPLIKIVCHDSKLIMHNCTVNLVYNIRLILVILNKIESIGGEKRGFPTNYQV